MDTGRKLIAEAIGTFFLCFAGIAAILATQPPINSGAGLLGIALAHGLALAIAVSAFGGISGAHHNPAVTLGFLSTGRISPRLAALYIVSQLAGATVAAIACKAIFPAMAVNSAKLGIPLPGGEWVTMPVVLLTEFILTFLLMTAIYGTAVDERGKAVKIGGFAIGLTVAFDILAAGAITGASMNPARSFGPAFVYGDFYLHWCYWAAPAAGAVAAALLYEHVLLEKPRKIEGIPTAWEAALSAMPRRGQLSAQVSQTLSPRAAVEDLQAVPI
jgi:MIP family channel proteins